MACRHSPGGAGPQAQRGRRPQATSHAGWALTRTAPSAASPPSPSRVVPHPLTPPSSPVTARPHHTARRTTTASASATTTTTTTVVERRAADVAVLGDSCIALAAAYSLARRGKKVVLLPDLGLTAPRAPPEAFRPLHLTHPDAAMVSLSSEAGAYWRGLQAQAAGSGLQLLTESRSLDVGPLRGGTGEAGEALGRLQDACMAAGVRLGSLRSEELAGLFPPLRLPGGAAGLLQPEGGVLNGTSARSLLLNLGGRQGVMLRERLVLRGWRDAGSHFVLRASGTLLPSSVSVFEVEQLLLAPGPEGWPGHVLRMFGADVRGLQVHWSSFARCSSAPELTRLPLWRVIGAAGLSPAPAPPRSAQAAPPAVAERELLAEAAAVVLGFPARLAAPGSSTASLKLGLGLVPGPVETALAGPEPWAWRLEPPDRSGLISAHRLAGQLLRGVGPLLPPPDSAAAQPGPGQPEWGSVALHAATLDGWPALGFLPGLEPGRLLFVSTASSCTAGGDGGGGLGTQGNPSSPGAAAESGPGSAEGPEAPLAAAGSPSGTGSPRGPPQPTADPGQQQQLPPPAAGWQLGGRPVLCDGYQLSPLLAKMAVDLLCGAARPAEVDWERLDLGRAALGARARVQGLDSWEGLARWQGGEAFREEAAAARGGPDAEEARERAEARAKGARMLGADARAEEEEAREAEERRRGAGAKVFTVQAPPA